MERTSSYVILDVGIVGAGITGLAAAISLKRDGHNVTVYERDVPLNRTGRTCYRTLVSTSKILRSEFACKIFELPDGTLRGLDGISGTMNPQTGIFLIAYPCRNGTLMNVAVFDRPHEDKTEKGDWNSPAAIEDALQPIEDFNESFKALIKCADSMKAFSLSKRNPLPKYVNGKAALIGDAAHPMLPILSGGGSTSLEDTAALGLLFHNLPTLRSTLSLQDWSSSMLCDSHVVLLNRF